MTHSPISFNDFPDEILLHIFKYLNNIEILYHLTDMNQRINRILCDTKLTSNLVLLSDYPEKVSISPLPGVVIDRFCSTILSQIGHQVKTLSVEETSMNRILRATNYPNLYELGLYDIDAEAAIFLFLDKDSIIHRFKNQISSLVINYKKPPFAGVFNTVYALLLSQILTNFTQLKCLKFDTYSRSCFGLNSAFRSEHPTVVSSTLLELRVRVRSLTECLYILDGRFDQLRALHVKISTSGTLFIPTEHKLKPLPNLRVFSLDWYCDVDHLELIVQSLESMSIFNESVVPLLHRMINLEELHLNIAVDCKHELLDGNTLKKQIIHRMPRLHKFRFNILAIVYNPLDPTPIGSKENIRKTFENFSNDQIIACVDHFRRPRFTQCHYYSYPYEWNFYVNITNSFPGGIFPNVTWVSLYDQRPFEYEFFLRIAHSFPFMNGFEINNRNAPKDKRFMKSNNHHQTLPMIKYPHLTILDLSESHKDYIELFLLDTVMDLPNNVHLTVLYGSLKEVTNNFTRSTTRKNCEKVTRLRLKCKIEIDERMKDYFPHTSID